MISYNELYEVLRKEKYSEPLQQLPKNFLLDVTEFFSDKKIQGNVESDLFQDSVLKAKKQLENAIAIFKELVLRRKKKLLSLVFVAAETGIMKRDYENMLPFERDVFDKLVKAVEDGDKELSRTLNGTKGNAENMFRMILFNDNVEEFVDMDGKVIGPFASGELANLESKVAGILVSGGKAGYVDEN